ncbi:DmsC/YnfH family molybdoenzyme membrane anchor subunit [Aquamicrobium sp. LC103]|uniref:dimethyl sulfoxide reductase anchor subunit family protein n=1 Tax=Aquamicrobium sp. LC103 TaxID=1120658 RepID=UPI00063E88BD|nr:DmsC/YnfH family molybdoenzyme membrane anchor subunit [Aquamicrobium sp. LC103]TKT79113.1 DMSO reductase [Aquamicrobium sp. LC103]
MHPALSIILFTTISGLGYGLAAVLGLGMLDPTAVPTKVAHFAALALISGGLLFSTLHLGNPQRAWRAFSQWRSSWLSREGVMAIVTFVPLCMGAYAAIFESRHLVVSGLIGAACAAVTVYCTSMIYASLKSVQAWHTPWTPACYLLFSAAGGLLLGVFFAAIAGAGGALMQMLALLLLAAAWAAKFRWRREMLAMRPLSTPESATGLGHIGQVKLFERPHVNENYLTREMGFKVARKHAEKLWRLAVLLGGMMPALLLVAMPAASGWLAVALAAAAVAAHFLGVLVERWLFFAEARHAVMNYYGG